MSPFLPRVRLLAPLLVLALGGISTESKAQTGSSAGTTAAVVKASKASPRVVFLDLDCDLPRCRRPAQYDMLLSLTDLWEGARLEPEAIETAVRNLKKTGMFSSVEPRLERDKLGVRVTFVLRGAVTIRRVEILDEFPLLESQVRRRLFLRPGSVLDVSEANIEEQRRALVRYLERLGYHGSDATIDYKIEGKQASVRLRLKIGSYYIIESVETEGNKHLSDWRARWAYLQPRSLEAIGLYRPQTMKAAKRDILDAYHKLGFHEARLRVDPQVDEASGRVRLRVKIKEGRRTEVDFRGNDALADFELRKLLTFAMARSVDPVEIRRSEQAMRAAYQKRGYHLATVKAVESLAKGQGGNSAVRRLVFQVFEGSVGRIEAIEFEGNASFSAATLAKQVTTRTHSVWAGRPGFALDQQLQDDSGRLKGFYIEQGFLQVQVGQPQVRLRQNGEFLSVHFRVQEGPQTLISALYVDGISRYSLSETYTTMGLSSGSPYGPQRVRAALARLRRRYRQDGLPHTKVEATCRLTNRKVVPCDLRQVAGDSVQVEVRVFEGPRVTIGEVFVRGNFQTSERTILRELPLKPGTPFDYQKLLEGQASIRSLGLFRSVSTVMIGFAPGEKRDRVGIVVSVEETGYEFVDIALAAKSVNRSGELKLALGTELTYLDKNVGGWGKQLQLPLVLGNLETSFRPTWLDPRFLGSGTSLEIQLFTSMRNEVVAGEQERALMNIPLDPFGLFNSERNFSDAFNVYELGSELRFQQDFTKNLAGALAVELERVVYRDALGGDVCFFGGEEGRCLADRETRLRVGPGLTLDRRDSPLHPTRGFMLRSEVAVGWELRKFDALADGFVRVQADLQAYKSFLSSRIVTAHALRLGYGIPYGGSPRLPTSELFRLGGSTTIRGLPDEVLRIPGAPQLCAEASLDDGAGVASACDFGGNQMAVYNLELRVRLIWWFWAVAFYDIGVLVDDFEQLSRDAVWQSAGVGLRWLIANQIPLRFDFGIPINAREHDPVLFHFSIGYPF